ncbi:MAG TPA: hypothetical protein VK204_14130 [Nocardioidaceae bacterium]|nr:hypothetical protein [Nocardioidaceae bacterium]
MAQTHRPSSGVNAPGTAARARAGDPAYQAFLILRSAFTIAPILFGADKFFGLLVNWDRYLAPTIANLSPFSVHQTMYLVGAIEIVAGLVVAVAPRLGAPIVSLWLLGIIVNLLLVPGFYDIALRDFGLLLAAVSLWRLAAVYDARSLSWRRPS